MMFINFLPQSWQSWALLLGCISLIGFAIILLLKDLRDAWRNENVNRKTILAMNILGASTEKREGETMPLSVIKAMRKHAGKIGMLVLGLMLGGIPGYMMGSWYQNAQALAEWRAMKSKHDQQYQQDRAVWLAQHKKESQENE